MTVTIKGIVKRTGVSYSTVSKALNGIRVENTENRKSTLHLAQKMGYVPDQTAINLRKSGSCVIELYFSTISKMTSPFMLHDVLIRIYSVARSKYSVVVKGIDMYEPGTLNPSYFDGITASSQRSKDTEFMNEVLDKKIPMAAICQAADVDAPNVTTDEALAMERATDYSLENGHRNIDIIEENPGLDFSHLRRGGWRTSMTSYGLDPDALPVISSNCRYTSGCAAAKQLLAFRPMALLYFNDGMVLGTRTAIVETGLKVPDDVSLVGFDNWDMSGYSDMHLTTVERNMDEIAKEGVRVLLEHLDKGIIDNRRIYLNDKLIIRDTVKDLSVEERKPS